MRTHKELYRTKLTIYQCELGSCPICGGSMDGVAYLNGLKTVETMSEVMRIAYRGGRCADMGCVGNKGNWPSAAWQGIAPKYGTYGYDVIGQIGWERQKEERTYAGICRGLRERSIQISETQVRYLYNEQYLSLLACQERRHLRELEVLGRERGLLLTLDGLMPEGGEAQLWVVRELQTGWTLRSGWMSCQDETAFVAFLRPIAELKLPVKAVMSDKQRGLLPAVTEVFPDAKHGLCQLHYLDNAAEGVAEADEQMKIDLRQEVRAEVGALIRQKQTEKPVELAITGMIPSAVEPSSPPPATDLPCAAEKERESIVQDIFARIRYLLTIKGRPPFRLAGIEMFVRLQAVADCVEELLQHQPEPRLLELHRGLRQALHTASPEFERLSQPAQWLTDLAHTLDPDHYPPRTGDQVRTEWEACLTRIQSQAQASPGLQEFCDKICKVSASYAPGLFYTYDIPGLPRTNNGRESEFRDVRRRLLATTGQVGAVKRLLLHQGAWELIPSPPTLPETIAAIASVPHNEFLLERQRIRTHRKRFRLHTRSIKQSEAQLRELTRRWKSIPPSRGP